MLKFGDPFQNILTLIIIVGFGYIIYAKWKGDKDNKIKNLFSRAGEIMKKTQLKGGGEIGK